MDEKKVVLLISSSPFSTLNTYEALRSSISFIDHEVKIIWKGEGVHFPLKSVDKTMTKTFLRLANDMEIELYVSEKDLAEKGLEGKELEEDIKIMTRNDLIEALNDADIVMTF